MSVSIYSTEFTEHIRVYTYRKKSVIFRERKRQTIVLFSSGFEYVYLSRERLESGASNNVVVSRITIINNSILSRRSWFVQFQTFVFIIFSYKTPSKIIRTRETHDFYNVFTHNNVIENNTSFYIVGKNKIL